MLDPYPKMLSDFWQQSREFSLFLKENLKNYSYDEIKHCADYLIKCDSRHDKRFGQSLMKKILINLWIEE